MLSYDDNVFRLEKSEASPRGHRSDFTLRPSVTAGYERSVGPLQVAVGASVGYTFHRYNKRLNSERLGFNGDANSTLLGCGVALSGSFSRAQSDLEDLVDDPGSKVNIQNSITVGTNVLCGDSYGIRPGFGYSHSIRDNSSRLRSVSDIRSDTYSVQVGYSQPSFGLLSLYGRLYDGRYPNRPSLGPGLSADDGIKSYSGGLSYSRKVGSRLSASASVGYMKTDPNQKGVKGSSGITYSGDISFKGSDRLSGVLGFSRDAQQSNLIAVSYAIVTRYSLDLTYAINRAISLSGGASISRRHFKDSPDEVALARGVDKTTRFIGGVDFNAVRRIKLSLSASHERRDADVELFDYTSNRISLTAGLRF